jgi:Protein of unknown function (DUF3995)
MSRRGTMQAALAIDGDLKGRFAEELTIYLTSWSPLTALPEGSGSILYARSTHTSRLGPRGGCLVRGFRRSQPVLGGWWQARGESVGGLPKERAEERETGFVAIVAATGIAKLLGATVPLWLVFRSPSRTVRNVLLFLCWVGGALLALYGLADVATASIRAARGTMENAIWYAVLWGPTWLLGGVLFLMTAWTSDAERRRAG